MLSATVNLKGSHETLYPLLKAKNNCFRNDSRSSNNESKRTNTGVRRGETYSRISIIFEVLASVLNDRLTDAYCTIKNN